MNSVIEENVLLVTRAARSRSESLGWFRVALGLYYLRALMTPETIDFKQVDGEFNRFIYRAIGKGHSIASVLQFMSGARVVAVLDSARFIDVFRVHCPEVPVDSIDFLLSLNLGVAKTLSGLDIGGPVLDWIERQTVLEKSAVSAESPLGNDPAAPGL